MLHFLPGVVRGLISFTLYLLNTLFWVVLLLFVAFLKLVIPSKVWRKFCEKVLNGIATNWISINNFNLRLTQKISWEVSGVEKLKRDDWYLVLANHQSWVDILVLQKIFNRKIPFLKFFLKKELIWVPFLGMAWWALDFPFMKRYSKRLLAKKPHLAGKDLEITKKACAKFKTIPVSVMNFVEGTRFTWEKHRKQNPGFENLLRPKAGGIAFVLEAMGENLNRILNVTISYPEGAKGFWGLLCGKVKEVRVKVDSIPISKEHLGSYFSDLEFRARFQEWLNSLWSEKDQCLAEMKS